MNQAPIDGRNILDPYGFWKAARDANLETWSKLMIDMVNSDEYAKATGLALEQILATSQPMRDALERSMTQTLGMLNMPSRAEVTSLAERLVNVEMRLDDLDAKLNTVQTSLQKTIKETVHAAATAQNSRLKEIETQVEPEALQATIKEAVRGAFAAQSSNLKDIETQLQAVNTLLAELKTSVAAGAQARTEAKADIKAEAKPAQPTVRKEQEAKPAQPTARKEQEAK